MDGFDQSHQERLRKARVLVVGAGGLGCPLLTFLVQAGVGNITLLDDDVVNLSNLNRQWLFTENDVGEAKVDVATQQLLKLWPQVNIQPVKERIQSQNADYWLTDQNLVIDCTDNLAARYTLDRFCHKLQIPLIFGGVRKFEGQVGLFCGSSGKQFSDVFPQTTEVFAQEDCNLLGTMGFVVGAIAAQQAALAVKVLCQLGDLPFGKLWHIDLISGRFSTFGR